MPAYHRGVGGGTGEQLELGPRQAITQVSISLDTLPLDALRKYD
jgi:hypothetical protein